MVGLNFIHLVSLLEMQYIERGRVSSHLRKLPTALQSLSTSNSCVNYKGVGDKKNFPP